MGAVAACLAIVIAVDGILAPFSGGMIVSAYAYGTDEEITTAGALMNSGAISDSGEMKGQPLMFYLSGKDIATVRFSCKNQQINFLDWTEKKR
ncbi:unknown [Firmicutes bacterium CAG:24]|nr:unknown [Firmicutes bacterium CAG:24]